MAAAVGWVIASFVFGAGSKVGVEERDIAYLTSRVDSIATSYKELSTDLRSERETVIRLEQRISTLESAQAAANATGRSNH